MADKFRFYVPCPKCGGSGQIAWGASDPQHIEYADCPNCLDEAPPFGAKVFDGVRHVYSGRFEEVVEE